MLFGYMNINKIKIKTRFLINPPRIKKMSDKIKYAIEYGEFEQPIVIDQNNYLIDGYTTYILAREWGYKYVKVKRQRF